MELHSTRCNARSFRTGDAASLAYHGNNRKIWLNLRDRFPHPFTEQDASDYIAYNLSKPDSTSFAIEVAGRAVGGISLHVGTDIERLGAELGYWLGEEFWGHGIATEAIRLVTAYAFSELELVRVFAVPFVGNIGSCRALEKAGYVQEGLMLRSAIKDGQLLDQYLYAAIRD